MIVVYNTVSNAQIKKDGKKAKGQIKEWFVANPKRRMCVAAFWYGKQVKIKKGNIDEQIDEAMKVAMK